MAYDILSSESKEALERLGENIRGARLARGWSQVDAANRALMSRATYRDVESGSPAVSIGMYAQAIDLYGLVDQLGKVAELDSDEEGRRLRLFGKKR